MIDYFLVAGTVVAVIHAYSYAMWLKENDNKKAFCGVIMFVLAGAGVTLYRLIMP